MKSATTMLALIVVSAAGIALSPRAPRRPAFAPVGAPTFTAPARSARNAGGVQPEELEPDSQFVQGTMIEDAAANRRIQQMLAQDPDCFRNDALYGNYQLIRGFVGPTVNMMHVYTTCDLIPTSEPLGNDGVEMHVIDGVSTKVKRVPGRGQAPTTVWMRAP